MTPLNHQLEALGAWSDIDHRLGALALSYLATLEKIEEIASTPWADNSLDRFENKQRMKDVGGAAFQYFVYLHESSILSLAKVIDDTARDLKVVFKFRFDSFNNDHGVSNLNTLQLIRCLANVIKHNGSELVRSSSTSATFLVDKCGMKNGWDFGSMILAKDPAFDIVEHIPKVYFSMAELVYKASGVNYPALELGPDEFFDWVYNVMLPAVIPIERPQRIRQAAFGV